MVPERWRASWRDNLELAQMADAAGIDFLLPIGRWKGYGGDTDYQGATFETITWATGLLAQTERITVFGTVHAPLFPPIIAAKQMVTADHVGEGRFGLNIVCGWNEGEFDMFGVQPGDHERRYAQGQEWIDALQRIWTENDFDFDGDFFHLHGVRAKPKPWDATRPVIMNAGSSPEGKAFAIRNCDALFTTARRAHGEEAAFEEAAHDVVAAKAQARALGHEIGVYTVGVVTVRPTQREADDYVAYVEENTDWNAVDSIMEMKGLNERPPEVRERIRSGYARGMGGLPLTGTPDSIAKLLAEISAAGFNGIAISFINYTAELPFFRDEVLPRLERLGLRTPLVEVS
jgi:dimethylsulfone monooxygenase